MAIPTPVAWALLALCCSQAQGSVGGPLKVAVAANFRAAFVIVGAEFERVQGLELVPVFGSSGLLATQVRQGAPFDAFLSADMARPTALVRDGLATGPVRVYARGRVALWTPKGHASPTDLEAGRVGLPNPKLAPYGQAAVECMQALGAWEGVQNRLVFGNNVAQVGHFLTAGSLPAGFVALGQLMAVDAPADRYWVCPENTHRPIEQGAVVVRRSPMATAAEGLLDFITAPARQARLAQLGYGADG